MTEEYSANSNLLTHLPVPALNKEQLKQYSYEGLLAEKACDFDTQAAVDNLSKMDQSCVAFDLGGSKIRGAIIRLNHGTVQTANFTGETIENGGSNYIDFMLRAMRLYSTLPVCIAAAGPVRNGRLITAPNMPGLIKDPKVLKGEFPFTNTTLNDAVAGAVAASYEAAKLYPGKKHFLFGILGSGLGGAIVTNGKVIATEVGHTAVVPELNPHNQTKPCGLQGRQHVCVENVASGLAIQEQYERLTGVRKTGEELAASYLEGDKVAQDLYNNAALLMATGYAALMNVFGLPPEETVIANHGGVFNVTGFGTRVQQILEYNLQTEIPFMYTKDLKYNAGMAGAAIFATTKQDEV